MLSAVYGKRISWPATFFVGAYASLDFLSAEFCYLKHDDFLASSVDGGVWMCKEVKKFKCSEKYETLRKYKGKFHWE